MKRMVAAGAVWLACLLAFAASVAAAASADTERVIEKGQVTYQYVDYWGEEQATTHSSALVVKNGTATVPIFMLQSGNAKDIPLEATYDRATGRITVFDIARSAYYDLKVGSSKVTVLNKEKIKQSELTLASDITVHLVGDYPCFPLEWFQKIGYSATFDGERGVTIDFRPKADAAEAEETKLYPFSIGSRYGYMDDTGKVVIEPEYEGAEPFSEGLAAVQSDGLWGYIDASGSFAIKPQFDTAARFSNGAAAVGRRTDGELKFGYIDKQGKMAKGFEYDWALPFRDGYAAAVWGNHFVFIDKNGTNLIYKFHEDAGPFSENLAKVAREDRYGYINKRGEEVVPLQFEDAGDFSEGLAAAKTNGKWGYIDKTGSYVIPARFDHAGPFAEGLAVVKEGDRYGYTDKTGKMAIAAAFTSAGDFKDGYAPAESGDKWGYIDTDGKWAIRPAYDFADGKTGPFFAVREGSRSFYVDKQGNVVRPRDSQGRDFSLVFVAGKAIEVNGKLLDLEVPPVVRNGTTLVPARAILESLGLELGWDPAAGTVTATRAGLSIKLTIDDTNALVNGSSVTLEAAPAIENGSTLVPVRFLSETVGAKVDYAPYRPFDPVLFGMEELWAGFDEWVDAFNRSGADEREQMALELQDELNEVEAGYKAHFAEYPNDAGAYMEYAFLLGELAQLFGADEIWNEAKAIAAQAAEIVPENRLYFNLYAADRSSDEQSVSAAYSAAAKADPYLVLNHALVNGTFFDAGKALSGLNGTDDMAIFCLNKALASEDEEERKRAKALLGEKYGL